MKTEPHLVWWKKNGGKCSKGKIVQSLIEAANLAQEMVMSKRATVAYFKKVPPNGKEKERRRETRNDTA